MRPTINFSLPIKLNLKLSRVIILISSLLIISLNGSAQTSISNTSNQSSSACSPPIPFFCNYLYPNVYNLIQNSGFESLQQTIDCNGRLSDNYAFCCSAVNGHFSNPSGTPNTVDLFQLNAPNALYSIPGTLWGVAYGQNLRHNQSQVHASIFPDESFSMTIGLPITPKKYYFEYYLSPLVFSDLAGFCHMTVDFINIPASPGSSANLSLNVINDYTTGTYTKGKWIKQFACIDLTNYSPSELVNFNQIFMQWKGLTTSQSTSTHPVTKDNIIYMDDFLLTEFPSIAASNTTICSGQQITLSIPCGDLNNTMSSTSVSDYSFTYDWFENGVPIPFHGVTLNKNPNSTTTYTLVASIFDASNNTVVCSNTSSVTVTVDPVPTIPIISSISSNNCVGTPVTLSVVNQSNVTFSWYFPGGVVLTGNTVNYTWLNTTSSVYVVATNNLGCTAQSATYSPVINSSYCCSAPTIFITGPQTTQTSQQVFGGSPPPNSVIQVDPGINLVINTSCIFDNCVIYLKSKSSIEVQSKLTITNNSFLLNCEDYWNGITINNGATLIVEKNSRIQDAENAIEVLNGGMYFINTAIFNRNFKSIVWQQATSSNGSSVYNSIFTSRDIPINTTVASLKLNNSLTQYNLQSLKFPFASPNNFSRGVVGIEANFVDNLANVSTPHYELKIGDALQGSSMANIFDNLDYGIWIYRSNVIIQNNIFQNLQGYNAGNIQSNSGTAILAYGNNNVQAQENCIQVGGFTNANNNFQKNIFSNCGTAVEVYSYHTFQALSNLISNGNNTFANTQLGAWVGRYGIKVAGRYESKLLLASNNITNCLDAINWSHSNFNKPFYSSIIHNVINSTVSGSCINGIAGTFNITGSLVGESSPLIIESNVITTATNGINLKGARTFGNSRFSIGLNTILLKSNTSNTKGISTVNGDNLWIHDNTISSNSRNYPTAYGIYAQNTPNSSFECNSISTLGSCMVFSGNCVNPFGKGCIYNNTYGNAKNGIEILKGGNIGTQGAGFVPTDNKWATVASSFTGKQILNSGAGINFYLRTINPSGINGYTMIATNIFGITLNSTTGQSAKLCSNNNSSEISSTLSETEDALIEEVIENSDSANLLPENIYTNTKYAMEMLLHDSLLTTTNDSTLLQFIDSIKQETVYYLEQVKELTIDSDFVSAQNLNQSLATTKLMEQNQITVNNWELKLLENPALYNDSTILQLLINEISPIANQCAYTGGEAVIVARAILFYLTNDYYVYDDDCDAIQFSNRIKHLTQRKQNSSSDEFIVKVSPNPTSNVLSITYSVTSNAVFEILNTEGLSCGKFNLEASKSTEKLNLEHLNSGYYIYKVILTNGFFEVGKFCIVR